MKLNIVIITISLIIFSALNTVSATSSNFSQEIYNITECNDGIDNDGDGGIDFATDDQCVGWGDLSESILEPQCFDTIDNDGDGDIDFPADAECSSETDNTENIQEPQCSDGIDNDVDGNIDYPDDLQCSTANDDTEDIQEPQCNDGVDNDGDGDVDYPNDLECSIVNDNTEDIVEPQCSDGLDNDSDGNIDYPNDSGCSDSFDNDEEVDDIIEPPVSTPVTPDPVPPVFPGNIIRDIITSPPVKDIVTGIEKILFEWSPLGNVLGVETLSDVEELPLQSKVSVLITISLLFALFSVIAILIIHFSIQLFKKYVLRIFIPEIEA